MEIETLLAEGRVVQVRPIGNSMVPFLMPGREEAVIKKVDISGLHRGDVVLYRRSDKEVKTADGVHCAGGKLVLHRIYRRNQGDFYMLGDSQTIIEGPVVAEQIRGKMVAVTYAGKMYSTETFRYRLAGLFWLLLRPLRPLLFRIGHFFVMMRRR